MQLVAHDPGVIRTALLSVDQQLAPDKIDLRPGHACDLTIAASCVDQRQQRIRVVLPCIVRSLAFAPVLARRVNRGKQRRFLVGRQVAQTRPLGRHAGQAHSSRPFLVFPELHDRVPVADGQDQGVVRHAGIAALLNNPLQLGKGQVLHPRIGQGQEVLQVDARISHATRPCSGIEECIDARMKQDGLGALEHDFADGFGFPRRGHLFREFEVAGRGASRERMSLDDLSPMPDAITFRQ